MDGKLLERIRAFTEAVVFLMKRKYQEGVQLIEALARKNKYFENSSATVP